MKHHPSPTAAMTAPPMAGPTMREALNMDEPVPAIDQHAGERREEQQRNLPREAGDAQQQLLDLGS